MDTLELPLFSTNPQETSASNNVSNHISEDKIVTPLTHVLEGITPSPDDSQHKAGEASKPLSKSLDKLFPEQQYEEKRIQKAKEVLGELANEYTDIQLKGVVAEVQCLAESWLDEFERNIFEGLTLRELLHEKGGK